MIYFMRLAMALGVIASLTVFRAIADPAPTPVPIVRPDFSSMSFLMGTWTCHQQIRGHDRVDTSTTAIGMDGAYMVSQDVAPPFDRYRTAAVNGTNYMTWDPTVKQWVTLGVDNFGGYYWASSPGWSGNTIVWTSKNLDGSMTVDTGTKISDTQTSDVFVTTDANGKVVRTTSTCSKQS